MAFRSWDTWNSYLDNDGNLLHGKIRFCRKGTTDDVEIFDRDGNPIRNPEFTDTLGRTQFQVFLSSEADVVAYFYKYVGTGEMMQTQLEYGVEEDYDPSRWAYQYSSDSLDPAKRLTIEAKSAEGVATMADLRSKNPESVASVDGVKMLWLYGYYAAGDTSPVLYVWDSASVASDDGGSVIQANSNPGPGRWVLSSVELHFDVRHFGVFPQSDKYSVDYSYTSQLANCGLYIDNYGLDAWFPDILGGIGYYLLDGSNTFSISGDIYCSDAVRFMCKTGTSGTRIQCHELHKRTPFLFDSTVQTGSATLVADWVNISWVGGNCVGDARIGWVIDTADFYRVIIGKEVVFKTNGSPSLQLDNCSVSSNKKITGNISISNCEIRSDWFADNYDWTKLSMSGNTILLRNCKDADTYVLLKNKQNEADYGDLGEQTLTNATLLGGSIVENAVFSGVSVQGATELHNVSGSVSFNGTGVELNAVDCYLYVASNSTVTSLSIKRGSISGPSIMSIGNIYLNDVDVSATLSTAATATVEYSRILDGKSVSGGTLVAVGNELRGSASVIATAPFSTVNADVNSNRFLGTSKFSISPANMTGSEFVLSLKIVGNMSDHDFVDDSGFSGLTHTIGTGTQWKYAGNYGGCPEWTAKMYAAVPYTYYSPAASTQYTAGNNPLLLPEEQEAGKVSLVRDTRGSNNTDVKWQMWWYYKCDTVVDTDSLNVFRFKHLNLNRTVRLAPMLECHFTSAASNGSFVPPGTPFGTATISIALPLFIAQIGPNGHSVDISGDYTHQSTGSSPYDINLDDWISRLEYSMTSTVADISNMGGSLRIEID